MGGYGGYGMSGYGGYGMMGGYGYPGFGYGYGGGYGYSGLGYGAIGYPVEPCQPGLRLLRRRLRLRVRRAGPLEPVLWRRPDPLGVQSAMTERYVFGRGLPAITRVSPAPATNTTTGAVRP